MSRQAGLGIHLALGGIIAVWGAAYPLIKVLLVWLSPMELMLARFWLTCLPLLVIAWRYRAEIREHLRAQPWRLVLLACLGVPGYHLSLNIGTRMMAADSATADATAMLVSILVASVPAWTALFAHLLHQERLSGRQWLGQILAFTGVMVIVSRGEFGVLNMGVGAIWVLGAPVSWALYTVVARPILTGVASALPLISFIVLLGTLIMTPFTPAGTLSRLAGMSGEAWGYLLFLAALSTFAGYLVWAIAIQRMKATRASAFIYFVPVTSALVSIFLFAERLSALVLLGGALILGGVLLIQRVGLLRRWLPDRGSGSRVA